MGHSLGKDDLEAVVGVGVAMRTIPSCLLTLLPAHCHVVST
jgi:hypothetical protein